MRSHDYPAAQDVVRAAIAGFTAASKMTPAPTKQREAREHCDAAAAALQRLRTTADTEVTRRPPVRRDPALERAQ